jgi:hypothetical protein
MAFYEDKTAMANKNWCRRLSTLQAAGRGLAGHISASPPVASLTSDPTCCLANDPTAASLAAHANSAGSVTCQFELCSVGLRPDLVYRHDEQTEDAIEDSARGVQGLIQDLYNAASHGINGNLYQQLMEEAKREIYPISTEESRLTFIIKLLHIKVYNRIINFGFNAIHELLSTLFLNVTALPKSYNETKALLWKLGFGYVSIHVCKYDCALFWNDHAKDDHCSVCGESRWKVNKVGRKKVPHKVLRYFPIIPRLQKLFISKQRAKIA